MEAPEQLRITWARGPEFLAAFDVATDRYTVEVPHDGRVLQRTRVGQELYVELAFADTGRVFRHCGRVAAHALGPPEIVTLAFVPDERAVRELVVCHAEGKSVPYLHRRTERRPVWLPIEVRLDGRWQRGIVTELSELGAFITTADPTSRGVARLRIGELEIDARVLYRRGGHTPGFGVEFVFPQRADEVHVQAVLRAALQATKRT